MSRIKWYGNKSETYRRIVRQPGIKAANVAHADEIGIKADMLLAPHHANNDKRRRPGERRSYIEIESGNVDAYVTLVDPGGAAMAISKNLDILYGAAYG